ncbi:hypothetical protein DRN69_00800 [Candidatus Pacearchaeota archaeon]|nr:MAG: hypothetical protein DRN69_00800 [Candidatus Pacearchaeota archaeon]
MQNLLLTISIPTYNGGDNLIRAIKSCKYINLSKNEFEILVVDNCSTDGSIEKVRSLMQDFPNIRLIINDRNYGRIGNWNRCLNLSRGKYLIFLFSNDEIYRNINIKHYIKLLEMYDDISLLMGNVLYDYNKTKKNIPNYEVNCIFNLNQYITTTFIKNFQFASLGILQQNIYKMETIRKYKLKFIEEAPRTTDRIFIYEVIKHSGKGRFLYADDIICVWHLSKNRFHNKVHLNVKKLDFKLIWENEYLADKKILEGVNLDKRNILEILMAFYYYQKLISYIRTTQTPKTLLLDKFKEYLNNIINKNNIVISNKRIFKYFINKFLSVLVRKTLKINIEKNRIRRISLPLIQ